MRFWFVHSGEVSLREQICTQVNLGIASGELQPGQRLPSTREMGRRFGLHPNTVSMAYQQLQGEGKLERRHGAGIFVAGPSPAATDDSEKAWMLDRMIAEFLTASRLQGFSRETVTERVRRWMEVKPPDHFLLVEPEEERREIVLAELREVLRYPVRGCGFEECQRAAGAVALALPSKAATVRARLPPHIELTTLQITNVPAELKEWLPVPPAALVGIVSRWPEFVKIARTMLVAAGFDADALMMRQRGEPDWKKGLSATAAVVCDVATAEHLPERVHALPFRLVSLETIAELKRTEHEIEQSIEQGRIEQSIGFGREGAKR